MFAYPLPIPQYCNMLVLGTVETNDSDLRFFHLGTSLT